MNDSKINNIQIILGTAHLATTPGKCSPDEKFRECVYSREIVAQIHNELKAQGYNVVIDYPELCPNAQIKAATAKLEQSRELRWRSNFVNNVCARHGTKNCIYVSIHVNAAGGDGKWHDARGWSVYTSKGKTRSDELATMLYNQAQKLLPHDSKHYVRSDWSDGDPDYEASFYVLSKTACPAVLTENLFQDNKQDVAFLTSAVGRNTIVKIHVNAIKEYVAKYDK